MPRPPHDPSPGPGADRCIRDEGEEIEVLLQAGKRAQAEERVRRRLAARADDVVALKQLSACLAGTREPARLKEFLQVCEAVVAAEPQDLQALYNLAQALKANKRPRAAFQALLKRVNLAPRDAALHLDAARLLRDVGQLDEAVKAYRHALVRDPASIAALSELAAVHKRQGQQQQALACYRKVLAIDPGHASTHNNLGALCADLGQLKEAIAGFREAVRLAPDNAVYHNNLGNTLYRIGRIAEASACYARALEIKPDFLFALTQGLHARRQLCDWRTLEADLARIRQALQDDKARGLTPFVLLSQPGISLAEQLICARRFSQAHHGAQLRRTPLINSARPQPRQGRKLRIGYLSADFHEHATSYLLVGVLEHHERTRHEIHAYSYGPDDGSAMRTRVRRACDAFHDLRKLTDEQAARQILADGIDILVDLKGYTRDTRLGIQALRPAPVVVSWLGYPGTLGEPRMADYLIGDPTVTPLEHATHYAEKLALMPHSYQPNDRSRVVGPRPGRAEVGLPERAFVFCTFNQPYKITPDMLDLWCRILCATPQSVLWLLAPKDAATQASLEAEIERRGLARSRLILAPKKPQAEHLARLALADLALDTLPYTSHTTCSDALWVGLPLLTLIGDTFPARVAAGLLHTMGLPELVTETPEAYVQTALALAGDPARLQALREKILRQRECSPLFDTARFTLDLEKLYRRMWRDHLSLHHDHIVPPALERARAAAQGRKPAPMRIAVITPYYRETLEELRQCHDSVLGQTLACTHFMVADGHPRDEIDAWNVRHIRLPVAHGDGGNCARATGCLAAIAEDYDAIALLDADNWYEPGHLETMLALHEAEEVDVCFARRKLHRVDGSLMYEDDSSDGKLFVDSSCYFVTRPAFGALQVWGAMPRTLWGVCDRVFFAALGARGHSTAIASVPTVAYRTRWPAHYAKLGETPPAGGASRTAAFFESLQAFMALTPAQRMQLFLGR